MRLKGVISDKTVAVYIFFISQFHLMLAESIWFLIGDFEAIWRQMVRFREINI